MIPSRWLLLLVGWTLFGALQAALGTVLMSRTNEAIAWLVGYYLPLAWVWAAVTPAIGWWSRAVRRRTGSLALRVVAHLPTLLCAALLNGAVRRWLTTRLGEGVVVPFEATLLYFADMTVASYLAAVWASRLLDARLRFVERKRRTHALEAQLLEAQMEALELQLRPHFLFNVLSTIAELAHEAPRVAADMLRNLVSLLEASVARRGVGLVSLDDEMRTLGSYLVIQRLRFADWLGIDVDVADDARSALVPRFVLQPLVENAVHHGLRDRTAPGRIAIRAHTDGERLRLSVEDDGAGSPAAADPGRKGLGLANVRARLASLYGSDASIDLGRASDRGTAAVVDIPLWTAASAAAEERSPAGGAVQEEEVEEPSPSRLLQWAADHPMRAALLAWSILAALRIQQSFAYLWLRDRYTHAAFLEGIRHDVAGAVIWLALTPAVLALASLVPLGRRRLVAGLSALSAAGVVVAFAHTAATHVLTGGGFPIVSMPYAQVYAWDFAVYAILVILAHFRDVEGWILERDTAADLLRRDLQEARFRSMVLEVRPQVLIDALRRLVDIVATDARRAEKILADVGDFLRVSLDAIGEHDVPLAVEDAATRAYAGVLRVAVAPGLDLRLSIPPALTDERVPNGILRALVDAILGERIEGRVEVEVTVVPDGGGVLLSATSSRASSSVVGRATAARRLREYAGRGLVELIDESRGEVRLRIDRRPRPDGGGRPSAGPSVRSPSFASDPA